MTPKKPRLPKPSKVALMMIDGKGHQFMVGETNKEAIAMARHWNNKYPDDAPHTIYAYCNPRRVR